jgi:hypothetical protein
MNMSRHPVSDEFLKVLLAWARALGAKDVPSFEAYKKATNEVIEARGGTRLRRCVGSQGNTFWADSVQDAVADVSGPYHIGICADWFPCRTLRIRTSGRT